MLYFSSRLKPCNFDFLHYCFVLLIISFDSMHEIEKCIPKNRKYFTFRLVGKKKIIITPAFFLTVTFEHVLFNQRNFSNTKYHI